VLTRSGVQNKNKGAVKVQTAARRFLHRMRIDAIVEPARIAKERAWAIDSRICFKIQKQWRSVLYVLRFCVSSSVSLSSSFSYRRSPSQCPPSSPNSPSRVSLRISYCFTNGAHMTESLVAACVTETCGMAGDSGSSPRGPRRASGR
jgi:hypothetical protein